MGEKLEGKEKTAFVSLWNQEVRMVVGIGSFKKRGGWSENCPLGEQHFFQQLENF